MKKVLLALSFLIVTVQSFAQLSYQQQLSRLAQIQFPDTPSYSTPAQGMSAYTLTHGGIAYVAAISPANSGLKNAISGNSLEALYDDFIEGNLNSTSGKLIYKKEVPIEKLKGLQFSYKGVTPASKEDFYGYQQVVFLNDTLFTYAVVSPKELKPDDKNIREFFTSFKLNAKADEISQDADEQVAFKTGQIIGKFTGVAIVIIVLGGIVFLIVKLSTRKRKKQWGEEDFK
ncbi:hypothetical protein [Mucilaginibacter pedocola]|uniref:PsbP C-terminal domain-containing protein n=1 Tax=Mucilaginibacter pedocola TaxID=1792845 RepID=A0A1S9PLS6_9SPHI|nr:hypothetical protein [Mucilaginibacter pedocola]OOQ61889.1 hypothetical protein BC343_02160 [Mucilaginibacter pedocola]